jgi:hypothetical protein
LVEVDDLDTQDRELADEAPAHLDKLTGAFMGDDRVNGTVGQMLKRG